MNNSALVIFAREPKLGKVKTRLARDVGEAEALRLYKSFVRQTLKLASSLKNLDRYIYYAGSNASMPFLRQFKNRFILKQQRGGNLGTRMYNAFDHLFKAGYQKVIIIGTDCLEITKKDIQTAYKRLDRADYVLGPTYDGGYYLIGAKLAHRSVFQGITWGTKTVFNQTKAKIVRCGKSLKVIPKKSDIDYLADLQRFYRQKKL